MREQQKKTPLESHLITFNPMKIAIIRGYVDKVSGILLSQYIDNEGEVCTNRTILTREDMIPDCNIDSRDEDWKDGLYFFKDFPLVTEMDVHKIIQSTKGVRDVCESFQDLLKLGCTVPEKRDNLPMTISDYDKSYGFNTKYIHFNCTKEWIPSCLELLYGIQVFLKRRIVLETSASKPINKDTLDMMNEILENQMKHRVYTNGEYNGKSAYNDGVKTYYKNGPTVLMTRKEFTDLFPYSYEVGW